MTNKSEDTKPVDIEIKYPYDSERYKGRKVYYKRDNTYKIYLSLKSEYRDADTSRKEKEFAVPISKYIAETEKLKRFLNEDEKVIFIDGNKLNYNVDNLKVLRKGEDGYSKLPRGEVPFQDYHIGNEYKDKDRIKITLYNLKDGSKKTSITRAKYRYELKLGRKLKRNERLVYKDGNHLNDNLDNLTHKEFPQAKYPFTNYFEGSIYKNNIDGRNRINLIHESDSKENLPMNYSRYRKQVIEGRLLESWEEVDHKDGNLRNDADDNLQILTTDSHIEKSKQDSIEIVPKVCIECDGCSKDFEKLLSYVRKQIKKKNNKTNNIFCSPECRWNYIRDGNNIEKKKLIKHICTSTDQEIEIPENTKFISSQFNPDALPFYDRSAVLKWMKEKQSMGDGMHYSIGSSPNFSLGSILGSSASKSIVDDINSSFRSHTYFGENSDFQFSDNSNKFIEEIVVPMKQSMLEINKIKSKLNSVFVDEIRPLTIDDDFYNIPQCMMPMMLSHPKMQPLMEQGRISGFGIEADLNDLFLPHHRIAYSGYVEDALENIQDNDGKLILNFEFTSIDPHVTDEECGYLRETYEKIEQMLNDNIDPTSYPNNIA